MERMKSAALASPPHTVTHTGQHPAVNPTGAAAKLSASSRSCPSAASSHFKISFDCRHTHPCLTPN
jgi:hypothetical protein